MLLITISRLHFNNTLGYHSLFFFTSSYIKQAFGKQSKKQQGKGVEATSARQASAPHTSCQLQMWKIYEPYVLNGIETTAHLEFRISNRKKNTSPF
jgi:hypothetical protein